MKTLVIGGGRIGSAAAWNLMQQPEVTLVGIADLNTDSLQAAGRRLGSAKLATHHLDIKDKPATVALMRGYDVAVTTLPMRGASYAAIEAAIEAPIDIVDVLEEYHRVPDSYEIEDLQLPPSMSARDYGEYLHERALHAGITILDGMGFAPGLSNITLAHGIRSLDSAESAVARVGGIPRSDVADQYPLRYTITWAFDHVLREYMVRVPIRRNGKLIEVDAMSDREIFRFTAFDKNEELESAITPGMPSFIHTRPELRDFAEKTIRWPGHWSGVDTLKECGLLETDPIVIRGTSISPREFTSTVLRDRLTPTTEADSCVMWNTVIGIKDHVPTRIDYYMWDDADPVNKITSMARVTAFTAVAGALNVGKGLLPRGIVAPEDGIVGDLYTSVIEELRRQRIAVLERISDL